MSAGLEMEGGGLGLEAGRSKAVRCSRSETMWTCPELGLEGDARAMGEKGRETGRRGRVSQDPCSFGSTVPDTRSLHNFKGLAWRLTHRTNLVLHGDTVWLRT